MARRKTSKQNLAMESANSLLHYLDKILAYLLSNEKSQVFPSLTMGMEDILVRIAKDTEFLKQGTFDDDCKSIVAEISTVLEKNKHEYTLSYVFENDELGKKVMVYKKISPVNIFKEPMPLKPLRRPRLEQNTLARISTIQTSKSNVSKPSLVMSTFKTSTLNATLKFVKNDAQLVFQYPDMTTEQADFVKQMIAQCMAPQERNESGFKGLYDPLTEALKIFSLKYNFELNAETHGDMKQLKFVKIPKRNIDDKTDLDSSLSSISTDSSIQINTNTLKKLQHLIRTMTQLDSPFIDTSINRLNDFLKDNTKDDLVFPDLNIHEMTFLTHWKAISKRVELIKMLDLKGQMVLDEIRDSVNRGTSSGKFRVKVTSKVLSSNIRSVMFTKTPMKVNLPKAVKKTASASVTNVDPAVTNMPTKSGPMDDISISDSCFSSSSVEDNASSIARKKIDRFFHKTKSVPETWIRATLIQLKSFIQDESQASLVIPGITNPQMAFLTKWQKLLSKTEVIEAYHPDVQVILRVIHRAVFINALKFKVSFKMTSVRKGQVRDITFIKIPRFPSLQPKAEQTKLIENINKSETKCSSPTAAPIIPKTSSVTSLTHPVDKSHAVNKKGRPKSATRTSRRTVAKSLPPAKVKLIEGLSQPLVSEKGLKMMRSMGWDGGALGLRGEGIVEPIMLQLDMGNRAGLGLLKPPPRQPAVPVMTNLPLDITRVVVPHTPEKSEFKTGFLQTISKMLFEKRIATELRFPKKLTLKNWSFVRHHVTVFNNRDKISMDQSPLNKLCHTILDTMRTTEFVITACWGTSKTNILIILSKNPYQPTDIDSNDWCSVTNFDKSSIKVKGLDTTNSEPVMVDGEPFRYYVLAQILEFCQQSNIVIDKGPSKGAIEKNVLLKGIMSLKQMAYIDDLIVRLNSKSKSTLVSVHENSLFDEIKAKIEEFTLKVDFPLLRNADENMPPSYKTIRLYKVFDAQKTAKISKNIPTTDKGAISKVGIQSVESIKDVSKNNKNDHTVSTNTRKVTKKDDSLSSPLKTSKAQNNCYIEFVNRNTQSKTIDNDAKNVTDSQNTHYFDANDTKDCICCLPDYADVKTEKNEITGENQMNDTENVEYLFIEKERFYPIADIGKPIVVENKHKDMPINTESDKNKYRSLVTDSDKEIDMTMVTDSDKENVKAIVSESDNNRPMVIESDKENDMPIATDSDKEHVKTIVTETNKENNWPINIESGKGNYMPVGIDIDMSIVTNSDKENSMPIVTDNDKENVKPIVVEDKHKDMPINIESDKNKYRSLVTESDNENNRPMNIERDKENDIPIGTDSDKKIVKAIVTESDKENNRPINIESDKANNMPVGIDSDMSIGTNSDKGNDKAIVTKSDIEDILEKHGEIIKTSSEMADENLLSLKSMNYGQIRDSADDHMKRELLKDIEYFKQIESTLKNRNESNQECSNKNEDSQEKIENIKDNQIEAKTDKDLGKRLRSNALTPDRLSKKCRYADFVQNISITPKDYPQSKITVEMAGEIQKSILRSIDYMQELPLLKCHGIQDGALSYSCHTEKSLHLIENVIKSHDFQVSIKQEINVSRIKMAFRLNTFLDESVETILGRLKMYNPDLSTKEWVLIKKELSSDYIVIQVEMDFNSFRFIRGENFSLYAGLDVAKFSIVWA